MRVAYCTGNENKIYTDDIIAGMNEAIKHRQSHNQISSTFHSV